MSRFDSPQSILITGASSGIGHSLAEHYAGPGITLFLSGRDSVRLNAVVESCRQRGAVVHGWIGDVCDEAGVREWITQSDQQCPLNLVIANAGVALGATRVEDLHDAVVTSYRVNVNGVFNTVHPALERMAARQPRPVNNAQVAIVSSVMGYLGTARSPAYSSSKAAIKAYGESLRGAFRNMGIGVSVICPGYVQSGMITRKMPFIVSSDKAAAIIARGLARNKGRITFPWQVVLLGRLAINLPYFLLDRLNKPWGVPGLEKET